LICSDSKVVKNCAAASFHPTTKLLSVADVPDLEGKPMYNCETLEPREAAIDLLSDLLAMARSRNFIYTKLAAKYDNRVRYSGFSILADNLRREPETIRGLFKNVSEDLARSLFDCPKGEKPDGIQRTNSIFRLRRWLGWLGQWRWNYRARRKSIRRGLSIRRNPRITEVIGPKFLG